jgi:hypothetical protein
VYMKGMVDRVDVRYLLSTGKIYNTLHDDLKSMETTLMEHLKINTYTEMIKIMSSNLFSDWYLCLQGAVKIGYLDLVKYFMKKISVAVAKFNMSISDICHDWDLLDPIDTAIKLGHMDIVKYLNDEGFIQWNSYLRTSVVVKNYDMINYFISKGADDWQWALIGALENGSRDIIMYFIDYSNIDWDTILVEAASFNNMKAVGVALERGAVNTPAAINAAIEKGSVALIKYLINVNSDPYNEYHCSWMRGFNYNYALYNAVFLNRADLVEVFIEYGANDFDKALLAAIRSSSNNLVSFFIDKGAKNWNKALTNAVEMKKYELINVFIDLADNWNDAMLAAIEIENIQLIDTFINKGANDWYKALLAAASINNIELFQFFVDKYKFENSGANAINWNDCLINAVCGSKKNTDVIEYFIDKGATNLEFAMECAVPRDDIKIINLLLRKGCNDYVAYLRFANFAKNIDLLELFSSF